MEITWLGHAAFKLTDSSGRSVITDPYTPEGVGYAPITETADLVIISSDDDDAHCRADLIPGEPEVVNALKVAQSGGTVQAQGFEIRAIEAAEWDHHPEHAVPGQNGMYRWEMDGLKIAHMGDVGNPLTDAQIGFLRGCRYPAGARGRIPDHRAAGPDEDDPPGAPRLVIPMHFRTLTYRPRNTMWIESFLSISRTRR
jgi:L-ascorbate metabolism protein UlaG (beta-lactamase superfamily)